MDEADLAFAGIARQASLIAAGEISSRELVELYLRRIDRLDGQLNSYRVVFAEQALAEADKVASSPADPTRPLLGVPVAVKDDVDVAGEITALGSAAHGPPATSDSDIVVRLRRAGAIILGKTNVPELLIFPFTESRRFGLTRNPWDPSRTPGGSSGGSGAAVAAGLAAGAQGSDGGGSIRIPAACCGLFGLKPQRARISLAPAQEGWHGLSVYGPLTRTVGDAGLFMDVAAATPPATAASFLAAATTPPGRLRIAVSAKIPPGLLASVDGEWRAALDALADVLRSLGHDVHAADPHYGLGITRFSARYLSGIRDVADGMAEPERLEPRTLGMARLGRPITAGLLRRARRGEAADARRINAIFERFDVVMTPSLATPAPAVGKWEGQGALATFNGVTRFVPFTAIWNHLGNPAASVPAGFAKDGMPLAVQLVGRPSDEATLLSLAAQIEAEQPWADRRPALAR